MTSDIYEKERGGPDGLSSPHRTVCTFPSSAGKPVSVFHPFLTEHELGPLWCDQLLHMRSNDAFTEVFESLLGPAEMVLPRKRYTGGHMVSPPINR